MSITYTATSLGDIATEFERRAVNARDHAELCATLKLRDEHLAAARVWEAAAAILQATQMEIRP